MTSQNQRSFHSFHLSARSFQKRFRETFGYLRTFGFITPFKVSGRKISVQFGFIMISFCVKTRLNGESGIIKIWVYLTFNANREKKIPFRTKIGRDHTGGRSPVRLRTTLKLSCFKMEPHFPNFSFNLDFQDSENETPNRRIIKMTDEEVEKSIDALFYSRFTHRKTRTPD